MAQLGFVGMGVMGARMAGHLISKGHSVTVWNRTIAKCEPFKSQGAIVADNLKELGKACEIIFICVSRTEDVEEVLGGLTPSATAGTLFVDHSTIAPRRSIEIGDDLRSKGLSFLDAPLTGGEKGAVEGTLTIFCGGGQADFDRAQPFMSAYGKKVRLVGPQGRGQMMKMANQISVAISVLGMAECLVFCQNAGLDLTESIELIGSGAGATWSLNNYGPKVVARDWSPGFAVDLQQKDLGYALNAAKELGVSLPATALTHQLFAALQNQGRGGEASPALFEIIEAMAKR